MSSPTETPHGWWQCRAVHTDGSPVWLTVLPASVTRPDGVRVDLPETETEAEMATGDALCTAHFGDKGIVRLVVHPRGASKAPPLWFAELTEPDASPPAVSLLAFSGHGMAPGTLIDRAALRDVAVGSSDQLGALRWYPATGEVDQIYVSPTWRRRSIGTALLTAAGTLSVARDRPRLWADGQRTAMGERFRNAGNWAHRAAVLTHLASPMTPFDQR